MPEQAEVKKPRTFRSLTVTLAISFLALSLLFLIIATGLEIYFNFQAQQKVIANQLQPIAQEAASTVTSFIQEKFSMLKASVSLGRLTVDNQEEQKVSLEKLLGLEPSFRRLILLNAQDREVANASRLSQTVPTPLTKQLKSDVLAQTKQDRRYISSVYIDEITSEPMMIMAIPTKNVFGDFQGTLVAEVNLKFIWDVVGRMKIGNKGVAYVVDRRGDLLAFGDISRVLSRENLIQLKEVNEFANSRESSLESKGDISKGIQGNYVVDTLVPLGTPGLGSCGRIACYRGI